MKKECLFVPKKVEKMIVLLHGFGSNGENMMELGHELGLKDTILYCPNGVNDMGGFGYNWFPLYDDDFVGKDAVRSMTQKAVQLVPKIQDEIRRLRVEYHLPTDKVVAGGFSQGGLVAMATALMTKGITKAVGMSAVPSRVKDIPVVNCPEILLTHGESDPVVPVQGAIFHQEELRRIGLSVQLALSSDLEHGVDEVSCQKIRQFLEKD